MEFTLTITTDGAAFGDDPSLELRMILGQLAERLGDQIMTEGDSSTVRDSNGNTVGRWTFGEAQS